MKHEPKTIEIYENDIELFLAEFAERDLIDDFKTVPQSVWNAALRYVQKHVFADREQLKSKTNLNIYNNSIPTNFNAYNYDTLNAICDIYIDLCFRYNKEISILGFSNLTGIDNEVIHTWNTNNNYNNTKLSTSSSNIYKKLSSMREESLSNKLADGKQNPVGVIAMLNRHYGWSSPYTSDANRTKRVQSDADLPKLGNSAQNNLLVDNGNA